jgi:hypothetical protein
VTSINQPGAICGDANESPTAASPSCPQPLAAGAPVHCSAGRSRLPAVKSKLKDALQGQWYIEAAKQAAMAARTLLTSPPVHSAE